MQTRWSVFVHGYIHENGSVTEEKLLKPCDSKQQAINELKKRKNCFVAQQEWDGIYWTRMDNTEIL